MTFATARTLLVAVTCLLASQVGSLVATAGEPKEHIVTVVSDLDNFRMYFKPKQLQINPGDTVTWVNEIAIDHNVLTYPDGFPAGATGFESPFISEAGESWSHTFEQEGTYQYHCLPHLIMGMHGTVIVGTPSSDEDFHKPSADEVAAYRNKLLEYFDQDDIEAFKRAGITRRGAGVRMAEWLAGRETHMTPSLGAKSDHTAPLAQHGRNDHAH